MEEIRKNFALQLKEAMIAAGYEPRPAVLEREFNLRYWGEPVSLQGVRRWLCGETIPTAEKQKVLSEWLRIAPERMLYGLEPEELKEKDSLYGVDEFDRSTIRHYLGLSLEQRKLIHELIKGLLAGSE